MLALHVCCDCILAIASAHLHVKVAFMLTIKASPSSCYRHVLCARPYEAVTVRSFSFFFPA